MQHSLKISIAKDTDTGGIVQCKKVTLRNRLLRRLLGAENKVMVIVPGNSVRTMAIREVPEEDDADTKTSI